MTNYISRFNPYEMDDQTILAIATGRKQPLRQIMADLEEMYKGKGSTGHLLVQGPRGIGKSFFSKYLQIHFKQKEKFKHCRFVLFPEEQDNIDFPSDFIHMVLSQVEEGGKFEQVMTKWEESEEDWALAYQRLRKWIGGQQKKHKKFLLVVLVENLDTMVARFKGTGENRFREMLESLPGFVLIGATPLANFGRDHNRPLFHAFKPYPLQPWNQEDFLNYFNRRRQIEEARTGKTYTPAKISLMENKLKAISVFTGGFPRMAIVLSNLLLQDDVLSTAQTLRGLIDELTPYYQSLTSDIPPKSRKLFDTLIRSGENKSQTELAQLLGTSQNAISRAFLWLLNNNYIIGKKRKGAKKYRYQVTDRIYCLYYKNRQVFHDQDFSAIWLLADLLVSLYEEEDLRRRALRYLEDGFDRDRRELARLSLHRRGMPKEWLPKEGDQDFWKKLLNEKEVSSAVSKLAEPLVKKLFEVKHLESEQDAIDHVEKYFDGFKQYFENAELSINVVNLFINFPLLIEKQEWHNAILHFWDKIHKTGEETNNTIIEAIGLEYVGRSLSVLGELKDAEKAFSKAIHLYEAIGLKSNAATIHFLTGADLFKLKEFEKAIESYKKALNSFNLKDDLNAKISCLLCIGTTQLLLNKFEECHATIEKALALHEDIKDLKIKGLTFYLMGITLTHLGKNKKALQNLNLAKTLLELTDPFSEMQVLEGYIGTNYILLEQFTTAWELLEKTAESKERLFQKLTDAVYFKASKKGKAEAFAVGNDLLTHLHKSADLLNIKTSLSYFFAQLLKRTTPPPLFEELCEKAKAIFPSPAAQTIIRAAQATVEYLVAGKDEAYLENLPPDMALAVQAIVREGGL
ncbi:MAG: hypothetical protein AAFZ15_08950 [Bacteroidota bacterium]